MDHDGKIRKWDDAELDEMQGYAMSQQMLDKKWWSASDAIGAVRIREVKLRARVNELEAERDRWYGAAIERMVRLNKLIESAEESIRRVEPKDIRLAAFRELRATITEVK